MGYGFTTIEVHDSIDLSVRLQRSSAEAGARNERTPASPEPYTPRLNPEPRLFSTHSPPLAFEPET